MFPAAAILSHHSQRSTRRASAAIVVLAFVLSPAWADAQQQWGELRLPGGARVARDTFKLGSADDRLDSAWLFDFLRHQLTVPEQHEDTAAFFDRYVRAIEAVEAQAVKWPEGFVVPPLTVSGPERDRAEEALRTIGLALRRRGSQYQVELDKAEGAAERAEGLRAAGIDRAALALALNAGKPVKVTLADSILPLPLPEYWREVFERGTPPIVTVVRNRANALRYVGLLSLDAETLAFLAARPRLVRRLGEEVGGAFAAFGRSLHVRNGVVDVPGGEAAANVWRDLVGRPPEDAERFVIDLLDRDHGRLAYFYDTVVHLSPIKQRFVLGNGLQGADRIQFVRRIAARFAASDPDWMVERLPFHRPGFDPAVAFMFVDVFQDGSIGPTWWPSLFEAIGATDDWPTRSDRSSREIRDGQPTALWMTEWLFETPKDALARFALLRFAQRRFVATSRESAPLVEIALRSVRDMPALPLALERMGVTDPAIYAAVVTAAHDLTYAGDAAQVGPVLARWQAALGLLEQAQRRLRLTQAELGPLLTSFVEMTPSARREASGATATWLSERLLAALVPAGPIEEIESRTLRAFTRPRSRSLIRFTWEGLEYVVDDAGVAFTGALAIRRMQPGPTLADLVRLQAIRRELERAKTIAEVAAIAGALTRLEPAIGSLAALGDGGTRVLKDFRAAILELERIGDLRDVSQTARQLPVVLGAIDAVADAVVPALVYALAVAGTSEPPAVYQETWRWHSILPAGPALASWARTAWQVPAVNPRSEGGGVMLRGAYLSIDTALADSQLARAMPTEPSRAERLPLSDRTTLVRALVLGDTDRFLDASAVAASLDAIDGGRRRVAGWVSDIPAPQVLREVLGRAAVDEWRAGLMIWHALHSKSRVSQLTPLQMLRLELTGPLPSVWDGPAPNLDVCQCLRSLDALSAEDLRGRESGVIVALLPNLSLRLAEHLRALQLPVALVPVLLPVAAQDWLDSTAQVWPEDWEALALWPGNLSRVRVEEYLLFLISEAVLASPATGAS